MVIDDGEDDDDDCGDLQLEDVGGAVRQPVAVQMQRVQVHAADGRRERAEGRKVKEER
jgi:hypothetical protein